MSLIKRILFRGQPGRGGSTRPREPAGLLTSAQDTFSGGPLGLPVMILTPALSWQHEPTLIPAKSFDKHGFAGLGLPTKIKTAPLKTTPGFLALSQMEPLVFPPVGLVQCRGKWAGGEGSG